MMDNKHKTIKSREVIVITLTTLTVPSLHIKVLRDLDENTCKACAQNIFFSSYPVRALQNTAWSGISEC